MQLAKAVVHLKFKKYANSSPVVCQHVNGEVLNRKVYKDYVPLCVFAWLVCLDPWNNKLSDNNYESILLSRWSSRLRYNFKDIDTSSLKPRPQLHGTNYRSTAFFFDSTIVPVPLKTRYDSDQALLFTISGHGYMGVASKPESEKTWKNKHAGRAAP